MNTKLFYVLRSRKFWAALIGVIFVVLEAFYPDFPISEDQLTNLIYLLIAYILGVALDDAGAGIGRSNSQERIAEMPDRSGLQPPPVEVRS